MLTINLAPEYIFSIAGVKITNTFLTTLCVTLILFVLVGLFNLIRRSPFDIGHRLEMAVRIMTLELFHLIETVTENRRMAFKLLPLITTLFLFIFFANVIGLIPGFLGSVFLDTAQGHVPVLRSPNSDLTTTLALAFTSVIAIQYFSLRALGLGRYIQRFINFSSVTNFITGFFEMISEGVKVLSFSFRLFGNIFAGEVLLLIIGFLVPYFLPLPFMILEVFVGIIQAFVFAMLTLTFVKMGTMRYEVRHEH